MGIKERLNYYAQFKDEDVFRPGGFNPGLFALSKERVKKLRPGLFGLAHLVAGGSVDTWQQMDAQMNDGDIQPAVVVAEKPLLVACYTEDFDAVVLLCFPERLGEQLVWHEGTRLLVVNGYNGLGALKRNKDLFPGPRGGSCKYKSVGPIVADLYTDNWERLERKKREIPEEWWAHTAALGRQYVQDHPGMARNGLGNRFADAVPLEKIKFDPKLRID